MAAGVPIFSWETCRRRYAPCSALFWQAVDGFNRPQRAENRPNRRNWPKLAQFVDFTGRAKLYCRGSHWPELRLSGPPLFAAFSLRGRPAMNLTGKIFTMLILIMSVLFMAFSVMVFATHRNWKEFADNPTPSSGKP